MLRDDEQVVLLHALTDRRGRTYDEGELKAQIDGKEFFGEILGDNTSLDINLARVSHRLYDLKIEDGDLVGKVKILDTFFGNLLKITDDVKFSIRAMGTVDRDSQVTDVKLVTFDVIVNEVI